MNFHNEDKKLRRLWPTAMAPAKHSTIKAAHAWCVLHPSKGRFYHHYTNTRWWFEDENDALMFTLKWGGQ